MALSRRRERARSGCSQSPTVASVAGRLFWAVCVELDPHFTAPGETVLSARSDAPEFSAGSSANDPHPRQDFGHHSRQPITLNKRTLLQFFGVNAYIAPSGDQAGNDMAYASATIASVIDSVNRVYFLPAIQRPYVWEPEQILALFDSLLKGYTISTFLFWEVQSERRGDGDIYRFFEKFRKGDTHNELLEPDGRDVTLVLDGQQRLTSLLIGLRGSHACRGDSCGVRPAREPSIASRP